METGTTRLDKSQAVSSDRTAQNFQINFPYMLRPTIAGCVLESNKKELPYGTGSR